MPISVQTTPQNTNNRPKTSVFSTTESVQRKEDVVPYVFAADDEFVEKLKEYEDNEGARDHYTAALLQEALDQVHRSVGLGYTAALGYDPDEPILCMVTYVNPQWYLGDAGNQVAMAFYTDALGGYVSVKGPRTRVGIKNTIQYNTIQYNTIQYNTIQYNTIQYNT